MAIKDQNLDDRIVQAATSEFLQLGFQKASLRKIAEQAGITTGALYTRYKSKDALFCSLIRASLIKLIDQFEPLKRRYGEAKESSDPEKLLEAIRAEEEYYLNIMFRYYDECVLFFCRSDGSSIEKAIQNMKKSKTKETVELLQHFSRRDANLDGVEFLIAEQFNNYRQILQSGYSKEKAIRCMQTVEAFHEAGWLDLFRRIG